MTNNNHNNRSSNKHACKNCQVTRLFLLFLLINFDVGAFFGFPSVNQFLDELEVLFVLRVERLQKIVFQFRRRLDTQNVSADASNENECERTDRYS